VFSSVEAAATFVPVLLLQEMISATTATSVKLIIFFM
jgi:hypothetical protein